MATVSSERSGVPYVLRAPTVMTLGACPGLTIPPTIGVPSSVLPRLPAEQTTISPAATARSAAWASGSSRYDSSTGAPIDRFTIRMPYRRRFAMVQSIAATTSLTRPTPSSSSTRTLTK